MDKNKIKQYLSEKFLNEAEVEASPIRGSFPAKALNNKIAKKNKKDNTDGVKEIAKELDSYEKGLTKPDANAGQMATNKFNYASDENKTYHDEMEIMNGQEMIQYDVKPNSSFTERAMEAIEGSTRMGNNPEWANVVEEPWGGSPDFGKKLVKKIKDSVKRRSDATPTSKMFGMDWEVVPDKGHKPYAMEATQLTKEVIKDEDKEKEDDKENNPEVKKTETKPKNHHVDWEDYEKEDRKVKYGNPYENENKKQPEIKETMKRLRFKKEFNGVGNALKLIPENYKEDKKIFEMTDGNENYRIRWEGNKENGSAIVLMASDKKMVNENIERMKALFNYKSEETLGTVKGKQRIDENTKFSDIWEKTKSLMEAEEDENVEEGWDESMPHAAEAKKHVEGSVAKGKEHQAPKPSEGHWEEAKPAHAAEAKKHVKGKSSSGDKEHHAPKPKTGNPDDAVGHAPEAKSVKKEPSKHEMTAPKAKTGNPDEVVKHAQEAKKTVKETEMDEVDKLLEDIDKHFGIDKKLSEAEIEKGKFTTWCKKNGFEGPSISCAKKAMASDSTSAHKMATFYMNTVKPKGKTTKDLE
jgi:hypothetical protein